MYTYWLSSVKFTVLVDTDSNGKITKAAPVVNVFVGQPLSNLVKWMKKQGGFKFKKLR
jgi:hypothetical protein